MDRIQPKTYGMDCRNWPRLVIRLVDVVAQTLARWRPFPDYVLDVAQGDSAVLELPDGEVVLIDGGASYERFDMGRGVVAPYLWNRGIRTIDYVIATHPQLDHVGGLAYVLRHFTVQQHWGTGDVREEPFISASRRR